MAWILAAVVSAGHGGVLATDSEAGGQCSSTAVPEIDSRLALSAAAEAVAVNWTARAQWMDTVVFGELGQKHGLLEVVQAATSLFNGSTIDVSTYVGAGLKRETFPVLGALLTSHLIGNGAARQQSCTNGVPNCVDGTMAKCTIVGPTSAPLWLLILVLLGAALGFCLIAVGNVLILPALFSLRTALSRRTPVSPRSGSARSEWPRARRLRSRAGAGCTICRRCRCRGPGS